MHKPSLVNPLRRNLHPLIPLRMHPSSFKHPVPIDHNSLAVEFPLLDFPKVQELLLLVLHPKESTPHQIIEINVLINHLVVLDECGDCWFGRDGSQFLDFFLGLELVLRLLYIALGVRGVEGEHVDLYKLLLE